MSGACGTCRFARGFPPPGPEPERATPPKGWWARLWWDADSEGWRYAFAKARHADEVNAHENLVRCHRYPETATKQKQSTCGEYAA